MPSLVLSWELFTKHLIRDVAKDGHLKLLVPIGKEVVNALSRERIEDAVRVDSGSKVSVAETLPAPNAWIPGGYLRKSFGLCENRTEFTLTRFSQSYVTLQLSMPNLPT